MGNTVSRSHIRDADRGVAKATRANTRRNSTNVPLPPPTISTPTASTTSPPPEDQIQQDPNPTLSENVRPLPFSNDSHDPRPVKRRARHISAESAFIYQPPNSLPDPSEPPPGASPAEVHAARTETPPRVDKPPRARKVVSFNENVHVVTYPYDPSNFSPAELPAITRYPDPKHSRRRSRSVFRLLSRVPNDHQCLAYDACCGLRIASDAHVVYDDQPNSDDRLLSFDSSKHLYDNSLVVSYERPYSDPVTDDFDYVHPQHDHQHGDEDTFSLSDAHPSCDAIDEPEAIGDQLLSREDSRDAPAFDIAPLWQRLKRVDELDAVSKNTFLRESARRRHVHDSKPPRPPRREAQGISHSRAARAKARRTVEATSNTSSHKSSTNPPSPTPPSASTPDKSDTQPTLPKAEPGKPRSQPTVENSPKPTAPPNAEGILPSKSITLSPTTPDSSSKTPSPEDHVSCQPESRIVKEPDPAKERRIPAPSRSRATSAGSIQKHMASFTTESAASTDREFLDVPPSRPPRGHKPDREDPFAANPIFKASSGIIIEPRSEKILPSAKDHDCPNLGKSRIRSEPHAIASEAQALATSMRTSRSARIPATYQAAQDELIAVGIRARATVRPLNTPVLPDAELSGENISHSWARLNDLTRKREPPAGFGGAKRSFSAPLRAELEGVAPIQFPEDVNERDIASTDRESDRTSTVDLDLDPLSLSTNDDYGMAPCSPVQGYAPIAGVYYGNSSPSAADPGSPRLELADTADLVDYPEYEMLNGNVKDDSIFGSESNTPVLESRSNWTEPFDEGFFELEEHSKIAGKTTSGVGQRDRNAREPVPEVLLHDWSGSTPVEPNVEMVDSAPNSRSSTSHLFAEDHSSKAMQRENGNPAAMISKRMNEEASKVHKNKSFKSDAEPARTKKTSRVSSNSVTEKTRSEKEKSMSSLRRSRSDRASGAAGEIDATAKGRGHGRERRGGELGKKFSLSNTEAWVSSDYEVKAPELRARSDAHEPGRTFFPALPGGFAADAKLHDLQLSVERKSVSEMSYRKSARTGRGTSFIDRELTDGRLGGSVDTWRDGKQEQAQRKLGLSQRRRRPSDVDNGVAAGNEGTLRGVMGRLVSGMHMAKRLVSPN